MFRTFIGESPKKSFGGKLFHGSPFDTNTFFVPGPGSYDPQKSIYDQQLRYSMGTKP